jgi:hypothetical protein
LECRGKEGQKIIQKNIRKKSKIHEPNDKFKTAAKEGFYLKDAKAKAPSSVDRASFLIFCFFLAYGLVFKSFKLTVLVIV